MGESPWKFESSRPHQTVQVIVNTLYSPFGRVGKLPKIRGFAWRLSSTLAVRSVSAAGTFLQIALANLLAVKS